MHIECTMYGRPLCPSTELLSELSVSSGHLSSPDRRPSFQLTSPPYIANAPKPLTTLQLPASPSSCPPPPASSARSSRVSREERSSSPPWHHPRATCLLASTGEIPCMKLFENEKVLAFLDIGPLSKGHAVCHFRSHLLSSVRQLSIVVNRCSVFYLRLTTTSPHLSPPPSTHRDQSRS